MRATMSVLGLYQWDDTIFDNLVLPDDLDSSLVVDTILSDCAELEIMYPDPDVLKGLIGVWSSHEVIIWDRLNNLFNQAYNPLENYDRTENWNQTDTGSSSNNGSNTNTHKVTGYNSGDWQNQNQDETYASGSGSSSLQTYHTSNIHGNIGIRSSQELLVQEYDLAPLTDIYQVISRSFKNRFCLMVY